MPSKDEIRDFLHEQGFALAGALISHPEDADGYIAFVEIKVDRNGKKSPGARALSQAAKRAAEAGYNVYFIAIDKGHNDFDSSLKAILFTRFGDSIRNAFSSFVNRRTEVWIEPKVKISEADKDQIRLAVSEFSNLIGFEMTAVSFTDSENTPTPSVVLKVLRTKSPCSVDALKVLLEERGFTVPNVVWLSHTFDKMRKSGLVVRSKNGEFFLSLSGLSRLGTAKSRQSPDILRALDFAKRGA